jgi:hypothetical protein
MQRFVWLDCMRNIQSQPNPSAFGRESIISNHPRQTDIGI